MNNCIDCGTKLSKSKYMRCASCFQKGKLNHNWKGGLPICKCGAQIKSYKGKNCRSCASKRIDRSGKKNSRYIDGHTIKENWCSDCNKKITSEAIRCNRCSQVGHRKSPSTEFKKGVCLGWIDGRTPLVKMLRNLKEYQQWRTKVFEADDYICQECYGKRGGNLEAHHRKEFHIILNEFLKEYDQFSPLEDKEILVRLALKHKEFWEISNGVTLCEKCHNLTKGKYGLT